MVVGAGEFQIPIIKKCREQGFAVIATDIDKNAIGLQYANIPLCIDTLDKEATLEAAIKYKIDGILTTSDYPVRTVAYVCENMGLFGLNKQAAEIATDKYLMRKCLCQHGIDCPKFYKIRNINELTSLKNKVELPLVVKPVDSSASRGVVKIDHFNDLENAYKEALAYSKKGDVIIEDFIRGPEYSVESLTQNGKTYIIAITEKTTSGYPYFVETRHIIPANISDEHINKIHDVVKKCIQAIGLNNSASHTELKLTPTGPMIIEIGARLGGDYITSDLLPLATGVDMLDNIIRLSLGERINCMQTHQMYSAIQFVTAENYDKIGKKIGKNNKNSEVIRYEIGEKRGFNKLKNSSDRLGYYIVQADSREKLICALELDNE